MDAFTPGVPGNDNLRHDLPPAVIQHYHDYIAPDGPDNTDRHTIESLFRRAAHPPPRLVGADPGDTQPGDPVMGSPDWLRGLREEAEQFPGPFSDVATWPA